MFQLHKLGDFLYNLSDVMRHSKLYFDCKHYYQYYYRIFQQTLPHSNAARIN